jgi:hypothetical protein
MPSSIFSFNGGRRQSQVLAPAYCVGTFLLLGVPTCAWWLLVPQPVLGPTTPPPPSRDYYLVTDTLASNFHFDHVALYHGLCHTVKYLKRADVLFLGNSRMMYGLRQDQLDRTFQRLGMSYYLLGFGHAEADRFPDAIVRKFDLHPKLVIVNADAYFVHARSAFAEKVVKQTAFEACKALFEGTAAHVARRELNRLLPHWLQQVEGRGGVVLYRSRSKGTWFGPETYPLSIPIPESPPAPATPDRVLLAMTDFARPFVREMEARGARVILTFIPSPYGDRKQAEVLASSLNLPLIAPTLTGLDTIDTSHLSPRSAERFTDAFVAELERMLLSEPARPSPGRS